MNPDRLIANIGHAKGNASVMHMLKEGVKGDPATERFEEAIDNIIEELKTIIDANGKIDEKALRKSFGVDI